MINSRDKSLKDIDLEIFQAIKQEQTRQINSIELIASENFVSKAVLEAQGSILTNKYAEGYPGNRYYSGCNEVDKIENLAINRAKKLFQCSYANVQPHSGSQANQAVFFSLLNPNDTILAMSLNSGGHLSHGNNVNISGQWFKSVYYDVNPNTYLIDYAQIEELAIKYKPKIIIAGFSCYSHEIDFCCFRKIANKIGAYLMADIAHISGIIAAGEHPNPFPYSDVVTLTTHKTLRGPRGGIVLSNNNDIAKKINKAVFPGIQGGPLMHVIAAKAVALKEALSDNYKQYIKQVISNAQQLCRTLQQRGFNVLTKNTKNHIVILDLRKDNITGNIASEILEKLGIITNKNAIPFDLRAPSVTSGLRLGSAACTTRGMKEKEFEDIAHIISDILNHIKNNNFNLHDIERRIAKRVKEISKSFPIY